MLGMAALAERRKDPDGMTSWLEKAQDANADAVQPGLLLVKHYVSKKESLKALAAANELARRFPENPRVLEMLARAQTLSGETSGAVRTFERLVQLRPDDARLQFLLGGSKWKAEDLFGAREAFNRAISLKPDLLDARAALAGVELQDGQVGKALEIAKQIQQDFPDSAVGFGIEGNIYLSQKRAGDALTALETGYSKQKSSQILLRLAQAYARADRRADAIRVLEDWMAEKPEDQSALGMLAMLYQAEARDSEAAKTYETLLQNKPKNVVILNNLAWLYQKSGDPRALETAKQAYDLDPNKPEVADTYGWIMLQNGKVQEGLSTLQQAYVAYPTQSEIGFHVAVALGQADRKDESIKLLRRLLRENPSFPQAQDAEALLEKLEQ
jgi:putative PEP-CTERM system TPR-repeat lipoprotein